MKDDSQVNIEHLLAEACLGDHDCLGALLENYRNYLYFLARTQVDLHLDGQASVSDLIQETNLKACEHIDQFRGCTEKEFLGWLRQILINNLKRLVEKNFLTQKRDVRPQVSLQQRLKQIERSSANIEAGLVSQGTSPSENAQRREMSALVADQLAQLPEHYREVIVLRNLEGLPFEEVARRMERTPGAVRVLWLRALEQLRQCWQEEDDA